MDINSPSFVKFPLLSFCGTWYLFCYILINRELRGIFKDRLTKLGAFLGARVFG